MSEKAFRERLNQIPDIITSDGFLAGQGLGNEIAFWIFDYPPEYELMVRDDIKYLEDMLSKKHKNIRFVNINLLHALVDYLDDRNFTQKAINLQKTKGHHALLKALKGPLHMDKFIPYLNKKYSVNEKDLIFITGIGSVWPVMRAHNILNSMHSVFTDKPVVLFYPGHYNGQSMSLFGKIPSDNYYRAFKLVP